MHKIFRYFIFSERLKGSPRKILALLDKEYSTENSDALPLLCIKNYDTRVFLKNRNVPHQNC